MLLYIVYYGPRQLDNQAYFNGVRGDGGGGSFSSIMTIEKKKPDKKTTKKP